MWIEVLEEAKGGLKGRIANEAEETREVKIGQMVSPTLPEISDWKYLDGNKLVGGFTIDISWKRCLQKNERRQAVFLAVKRSGLLKRKHLERGKLAAMC